MASVPIFDKRDQQIGAVASALALTFLFIILVLITYQIADPPPEPFVQPAATELENLEIDNLKVEMGGASEGSPNDDPVTEPRPQTQQVLTKKENPDTKTNTGKGTATNAPNSDNEASNTKKSNNPFGSGGGGDSGTGSGVFGQDKGVSGSGPGGIGDGAGRIRLNDPVVDNIMSDENHLISLRLTINAEGNVVAVQNIASKTTTTDQRIINQVIAAVKAQVKYNKKPGAGLESVYLPVNVKST